MADNKKKKVTDASYGVTNNNAIDVHVGKRIRLRRTLLGYSQEHLAHGLSVTFQQVQKYERGSNRVSASRLWDISQLLEVDISYFFDDMSSSTQSNSPRAYCRNRSGNCPDSDVLISYIRPICGQYEPNPGKEYR